MYIHDLIIDACSWSKCAKPFILMCHRIADPYPRLQHEYYQSHPFPELCSPYSPDSRQSIILASFVCPGIVNMFAKLPEVFSIELTQNAFQYGAEVRRGTPKNRARFGQRLAFTSFASETFVHIQMI